MVTVGADEGHFTRARLYIQDGGALIACKTDPYWPPMALPAADEVLPSPRGSR